MSLSPVRFPSLCRTLLAARGLASFVLAFLSRLVRLFSAPVATALRSVVRRRRYAGSGDTLVGASCLSLRGRRWPVSRRSCLSLCPDFRTPPGSFIYGAA